MNAAPVRAEQLSLVERGSTFAILLVAEFLYGWAWSTVDVLRPQLRAASGATLAGIGVLYTVQAGGALVGAILLGQAGDRYGRRNTLAVVLVSFGLVLIFGAFVDDYELMLAQRCLLGTLLGGVQPLVSSLYLGLFAPNLRGKLSSGVNAVFTLSVVGLGFALGLLTPSDDWRILLWIGGGLAIALGPILFAATRDDRSILTFGGKGKLKLSSLPRASLLTLFEPRLRSLTILIAIMAGLNYFAAQAFGGWTSTFLAEDRALAPASVGAALAWQAGGSLIGGFFWGWFGDRYGRKANVIGYVAAALLMIAYLFVVRDALMFRVTGFLIGFAIAANVVWPPWVAELFPDALRATALSIFNWGRIVSLTAPLLTGALAEAYGLAAAMMLAPPALLLVALLWRRLPETARG